MFCRPLPFQLREDMAIFKRARSDKMNALKGLVKLTSERPTESVTCL